MSTQELITEVTSLPIEERTRVVDSLLQSLNSPDQSVDAEWAQVANERLQELRSGKVKAVPGEEVFGRVWNRFSE